MTKQELKQEKAKLSKMNTKDKLSYIFAYYSTQIIIACVIIFLLIEASMAYYRSTLDNVLYCLFVNETYMTNEEAEFLKEDFRQFANLTSKKQVVNFDISLDLDDPYYADASIIKLTSLHSTQTMDTIVTTGEILDRYCDQYFYLDLNQILPENLLPALSDRLYFAKDSSGNTTPIGISLEGSYLSDIVTLEADSYLAITNMNLFPDTVLNFIEYCLGI